MVGVVGPKIKLNATRGIHLIGREPRGVVTMHVFIKNKFFYCTLICTLIHAALHCTTFYVLRSSSLPSSTLHPAVHTYMTRVHWFWFVSCNSDLNIQPRNTFHPFIWLAQLFVPQQRNTYCFTHISFGLRSYLFQQRFRLLTVHSFHFLNITG